MNALKGDIAFDPYELLGITKDCADALIVKAFRKAALKWHPDKNLDNKKAAEEMFLKISQAFELLSDPAAKTAYDRLQAAKTAKAIYLERRKQTDSAHRSRLREELERREASASSGQEEARLAQRNLEIEIERLRKEGSKLLQRERENIEKEVHQNAQNYFSRPSCSKDSVVPARLKVKWKLGTDDSKIFEEDLEQVFGVYGKISAIVMSSSGKGTAMIEYEDARDALKAEHGIETENMPFKVSWISGRPKEQQYNFFKPQKATAMATTQRSNITAAQLADLEAETLAKMMGTTKKFPGDTTSKFDDL